MDFCEDRLQLLLQLLIFGPLVKFTDEVATNFEGIVSEVERGATQIL